MNDLALEFVRVTEAAAIAAARFVGKGDKHAADGAAVDEMRARFNQVDFRGVVVAGEGAKDEAPELYTGERLGTGKGPLVDVALDPLECTDSVAYGRPNAISVIATGPRGSLFRLPDVYMDKLAVGPQAAKLVRLDASPRENIQRVAKALGKPVGEVTVMLLDRPRHEKLIAAIRAVGARVKLITDGDVAGAIAPCLPDSGVDMLMGIGASTEAVLAAAAIRSLGGEILCRFAPSSDKQLLQIKQFGIVSLKKVYRSSDLVKSRDVTFTATGVLDGPLLQGVKFTEHTISTHSLVIRGISGTVRSIVTEHRR